MHAGKDCARVDDIADMTRTNGIEHFIAALVDVFELLCLNAVFPQEVRRERGRLNIEADIAEAPDKRQRFLLVLVRNGNQHGAVFEHRYPCRLEGLVKRTGKALIVAYCFAGRFHLRGEISVHAAELCERKGRRFNIPPFFIGQNRLCNALLFKTFTEHYAHADINKAAAR